VLEWLIGPADMIKELDRRLKVMDQVIRHLVIRVDEDMAVAERRRSERQAERAQRRAARGLPPEVEPEAEAPAATPQDDDDEGESAGRRRNDERVPERSTAGRWPGGPDRTQG